MIVFDDVSKKYKTGNIALQNATFQIEDNDFVFLVGHSGAGKTTILNMILRSVKPTSGTVMVNGTDITHDKFTNVQELRQTIGVIFQDFKILHDRNIFENISISMHILGLPRGVIEKEVDEVLELVGLMKKKYVFPIQLSAGELQRVAIARAIVGDRNIILADEPTGNLDPKTTWEIMKIFKKLDGKKTIIIATHNVDIVNTFRKRVLTLQEGKIIKDVREGKYEL